MSAPCCAPSASPRARRPSWQPAAWGWCWGATTSDCASRFFASRRQMFSERGSTARRANNDRVKWNLRWTRNWVTYPEAPPLAYSVSQDEPPEPRNNGGAPLRYTNGRRLPYSPPPSSLRWRWRHAAAQAAMTPAAAATVEAAAAAPASPSAAKWPSASLRTSSSAWT